MDKQQTVESLNRLLRGEISAVETYEQVIEKVKDSSELSRIMEIANDHREAVSTLTQHILDRGGQPEKDSGAWGSFVQTVTGSAKVLGDKPALEALKQGERIGLADYEAFLKQDVDQECKSLVQSKFLPRQKEHINAIDSLMH